MLYSCMPIIYILFEISWKYDMNAIHHRRWNIITIWKNSKKFVFAPLKPKVEESKSGIALLSRNRFLSKVNDEGVCYAIFPYKEKNNEKKIPNEVISLMIMLT